jgi:dTDP-4-amino-4,6-dideoxy-D-galactose acyltransferase
MMQTALPDTEVCELLPWDSSFFGVKIGRVAPRRLSADTMAQVLEWRRSQQVRCLYLQADPDDGETIHLAEAAGFHLVDVRVTLERKVKAAGSAAATAGGIRLYRPEDLQRLKAIARASHADSRFFFDRHFPEERAGALFETWIERSCGGWAQAVFVAEVDGAAGYTTCHLDANGTGSIGLVGLAPEAQGRGLGGQLIQAAIGFFERQAATRITVVTQGRNVRAQRLYQRCGFVTESLLLWYHWWAG